MESTTCEQIPPKPLILNDRDFLFLVLSRTTSLKRSKVVCESASLTRPTLTPALDDYLLFGIELDSVASLGMEIAEEARLPSAEWKVRNGCCHANVDADVPGGSFVLETPRRRAIGGEQRRSVAVLALLDDGNGVFKRIRVYEAQNRAEDFRRG